MKDESPSDRGPRRTATKVVLFDGRCDLCQRSRKWASRLDWLHTANWVDFRDPQVRAAIPQLTDEQLEKEMWVFTADGEVLPGFAGWRHLLLGFPLTYLPALLMYVPPIPFIGKRVYAFIAARRPMTCRVQTSAPAPGSGWQEILQRAATAHSAGLNEGRNAAALLLCSLLSCALMMPGCGRKGTQSPMGDEAPTPIKLSAAHSGTVTVAVVGDILLGDDAAPQLATNGFDWPFERTRPLLGGADLVIGNLAAPITPSMKKHVEVGERDLAYEISLATAPVLKRAGFHALSLGNNHVLDDGVSGLEETMTALETNNIAVFGAGESEEKARRGLIYDFGTLRIGLLAYGEGKAKGSKAEAKGARGGYAVLSEKNLEQDIPQMRQHADVVVVSVHWGKNYKDVTEVQHGLGRRAIELGADIVYGHHSHLAQGIEIYQGKPILYGLGNFVFGTRGGFSEERPGYGLVSRWVFEGKTLKWILATPIAVNNKVVAFQPQRVSAEEARKALEPHLKQYNTEARWDADTAFIGFGEKWQTAALPAVPWSDEKVPGRTPAPSNVSLNNSP